jgi:archaellum component FlaC
MSDLEKMSKRINDLEQQVENLANITTQYMSEVQHAQKRYLEDIVTEFESKVRRLIVEELKADKNA